MVAKVEFRSGLISTIQVRMSETDAERFRKEAEECRDWAARAINPTDKEAWLHLAADWIRLAEDAEQRHPRKPPQFAASSAR